MTRKKIKKATKSGICASGKYNRLYVMCVSLVLLKKPKDRNKQVNKISKYFNQEPSFRDHESNTMVGFVAFNLIL